MRFLWCRFTVYTLEMWAGFLWKAVFPLLLLFTSSICLHLFQYLYEISWLKLTKREQIKPYMKDNVAIAPKALPPGLPGAPHTSAG